VMALWSHVLFQTPFICLTLHFHLTRNTGDQKYKANPNTSQAKCLHSGKKGGYSIATLFFDLEPY